MKMGFDSRSGVASVVFTESDAAPRAPAPAISELAAHFPELEIRELVAQGGMGCVYRARQKSLERDVALKILTVGTDDPSFAGRFEREARTLAGLSHPGIVSVFEFGQRGPWAFLVMEFVEGASLRQMMRAKTVGPRESLSIVTQICDALQFAHDKGVVHRDIKPENVLVTRDGRVKVLDFGLAKLVRGPPMTNLTQAHQVMGTPHYMAPEQWERPASVDHRADIYALGVVFYELLTGELPMGRFAPPSHKVAIDVRLDEVVLRSLEREPDRRFQHASQMKDTVAGIVSTPGARNAKVGGRSAGRPLFWLVVTVSCLAIVTTVIVLSVFVLAPREPTRFTSVGSGANVGSGAGRATQVVERDAASAYVDAGMTDLEVGQELAQHMLLGLTDLDELNGKMRGVWKDYLALEDRTVTATWLPDGWLDLQTRDDHAARQSLVERATQAISNGMRNTSDPERWEPALRRHAEQLMRFGARAEHLAVEVDDAGSHMRADEGESEWVSYDSTPPDPAYARLWHRMLPTRPQWK
jgi:predicted Ser/Thr protein kinase